MQEGLVVFRLGLLLPEVHHAIGFGLAHEGTVHADQARRTRRQEQHVALAQQMFGAHHVQHRARIDARGHAEADPRRESSP